MKRKINKTKIGLQVRGRSLTKNNLFYVPINITKRNKKTKNIYLFNLRAGVDPPPPFTFVREKCVFFLRLPLETKVQYISDIKSEFQTLKLDHFQTSN